MTSLELAALNNVNPWTADNANHLGGSWRLIANDTIYCLLTATVGRSCPV